VLDSFINFTASFIIVMLPFYFLSDRPLLSLLLLPMALVPLLIGTLSITVILSVLNVFYRDINFVMGFVFSLLFFLTPIFYPIEYVPLDYRWMVQLNPVIYFIDPFRSIIHSANFDGFLFLLVKSFGVAIIFSLLALFIWNRKQNDFYRRL
jgi:lipopolysaccharide transport system permease protein